MQGVGHFSMYAKRTFHSISPALPYRATEFSPKLTAAFFEALILEHREAREPFAQEFGISTDNP